MNVVAVVVTYNRLHLLKETIVALRSQDFMLNSIVVVNNSSTDGTKEYLESQTDICTINQENVGGAGGFNRGIIEAYKLGADWIWLMDDDTIPLANSLKNLLTNVDQISENVGFVCSKCVWTDGNPHKMNLFNVPAFNKQKIPFNQYDNLGYLLINECSFVSVCISKNAVEKVGLPYSEFYIWGDDIEFTSRITAGGFLGLYSDTSVVIHKTPENYCVNIETDSSKNIWKYEYGIRNEIFLLRKNKRKLFGLYFILLFYKYLKRINKRQNHQSDFFKMVLKSFKNGLFFRPKIKYVNISKN